MKVVILCGGYGTRIRDVSEDIPKPMIPVGDAPILLHIMRYYASFGFNEFVLCLGYKSEVIKNFFLNYEAYTNDFTVELGQHNNIQFHNIHNETGWKITLAETGLNSMTGSRVKKVQKYIGDDENFMLTYGDGVGDIDIKALIDFHSYNDKVMTVTGVRPPGRFGELEYDESGMITAFNEKPQAIGGRISGGFFVCKNEIFNYLNDNDDLVFEVEPMNSIADKGEMMVYKHDGFWQPMDTYRDYKYLNKLYEDGKAAWKKW